MELVEYKKTVNGKEVTKKHYPKLYGKARKQQKRDEAEARQEEYNKLSLQDKIKQAVPNSKQHKRLLLKKEKENAST
tara:strand:- start:199 stop:429 length:231 start_codon:yes stop_codon:yes gene_type:complete